MTQLSVHPLGLSSTEVASLNTYCRLASRRTVTWSLASTIDEATGILAKASTADLLAACQHYQGVGGCILLLETGLTQGMKSVRGPLQLSGAFVAFDYFQRNSKVNSALLAHIATQDLLLSFSRATANGQPAQANTVSPDVRVQTVVSHTATAQYNRPGVHVLPVAMLNQKPEVLIVDDSQVAQKYMENCLLSLGVASDLACSGDEALVMLSRHAYKYVFLDVSMVGLDGYQTCRAIKSYKGHTHQPGVFMTTSRVGAIDKIRGSLAGCDAYLTKPIDPTQLSKLLSQLTLAANVRQPEARQTPLRAVGTGATNP